MRPIHRLVFELQNMHFNFRGDFRWNVREFEPALQRMLDEARAEGRREGRIEMAQEAGNMLTNRSQKVV